LGRDLVHKYLTNSTLGINFNQIIKKPFVNLASCRAIAVNQPRHRAYLLNKVRIYAMKAEPTRYTIVVLLAKRRGVRQPLPL
jgi:hypothetical protein